MYTALLLREPVQVVLVVQLFLSSPLDESPSILRKHQSHNVLVVVAEKTGRVKRKHSLTSNVEGTGRRVFSVCVQSIDVDIEVRIFFSINGNCRLDLIPLRIGVGHSEHGLGECNGPYLAVDVVFSKKFFVFEILITRPGCH